MPYPIIAVLIGWERPLAQEDETLDIRSCSRRKDTEIGDGVLDLICKGCVRDPIQGLLHQWVCGWSSQSHTDNGPKKKCILMVQGNGFSAVEKKRALWMVISEKPVEQCKRLGTLTFSAASFTRQTGCWPALKIFPQYQS